MTAPMPTRSEEGMSAIRLCFGSVLAVDGLGLLDGVALGQLRAFACITLSTTPTKLTRCMNLLSGTLYKGAKLRIGDAKPDWEEQIEADEEKYWHLTALQHLIRPALEPPKRARRVVIDPPRWGAVHFTGELLEAGAVVLPEREVGAAAREAPAEKVKTKKRKGKEIGEMESDVGYAEPAPGPTVSPANRTKAPPVTEEPLLASFVAETHAGLGLLKQMFAEGLEWADQWAEVDSEVEELEGGREGGRARERQSCGRNAEDEQSVEEDEGPAAVSATAEPVATEEQEATTSSLDGDEQDKPNADFSSYPLFFSTWDEEGNPVENHTTLGGGRKPKTFWDVAREKGWMDGWKREMEDGARQRWEEVRGQLTQEWKKRSREAKRRKKATGLVGAGDWM
ncbi:hypothetical protein CALVIDRAFT_557313 [Calocera viscosa TUFC12733]|uniref:Uncharacterized protein n=1 Tax=Calocera viscosa (strain TUFC12733) TaxID=1330018 RepID=A0A167IS79_CALVF|nr:hypothetical protein CALVIDRAFT_557313 [Calocera viscosa TUFC12733]